MEILIRKVKLEDLDAVTQVEAVCFPKAEAAPRESFLQRISTFPDSLSYSSKTIPMRGNNTLRPIWYAHIWDRWDLAQSFLSGGAHVHPPSAHHQTQMPYFPIQS